MDEIMEQNEQLKKKLMKLAIKTEILVFHKL